MLDIRDPKEYSLNFGNNQYEVPTTTQFNAVSFI